MQDIVQRDEDDLKQQMGEYGAAREGSGAASSPNPVGVWKSKVMVLVESLWKTPPEISIMDMSLKTTYLLKISRTGELLDKSLLISSGNSPFDRSVFLALHSVTTFPAPPLVLIAGRDAVEVTMSFTPPKGAQ
ncbi:MAG TPA: TonB C-terminal domain-containing protein [Deltaproteobacteria bacterium]|nr:TonB C-terminal domain-containing protein [Deltaproteobacteria bacterium]